MWTSRGGTETIIKLREVLELKEEKNVQLNIAEVEKRGYQIKTTNKEYILSDLGTPENEISEELKTVDYIDIEDLALG